MEPELLPRPIAPPPSAPGSLGHPPPIPAHPRIWDRPVRVLAIIVAAIFASEVAIMLVMMALPPLSHGVRALVDAALLALTLLPLLVILLFLPFKAHIADRDRALQSLIVSEQRFRDIAEHANEWLWEVDAEGRYTYSSPVIQQVLGYTPEEIIGTHFYDLFRPEDRDALKQEAFKNFAAGRSFHNFINRNVHKNGTSVWLATSGIPIVAEDGQLLGYRGADTVKHEESAITDELTGVLNRQGFYLLAEQQLRIALRNGTPVALAFADMDGLKAVNDSYGHAEGDRALIGVAQILRSAVRESDIVARFGGDEFVVLLTGTTKADVEEVLIQAIRNEMRLFNATSNRGYDISISVGVVPYDPERPCTLEELILSADRLMYEGKRLKRSRTT